jgi:hypothetical protein
VIKSFSNCLSSDSLTEQLDQQRLYQQWLSQIFVTGRFDVGNNSSSEYFHSDSLTEQITCRATLSVVILPETRPELCHWSARLREQLFQRTPINFLANCLSQEQRRERESFLERAGQARERIISDTSYKQGQARKIDKRDRVSWEQERQERETGRGGSSWELRRKREGIRSWKRIDWSYRLRFNSCRVSQAQIQSVELRSIDSMLTSIVQSVKLRSTGGHESIVIHWSCRLPWFSRPSTQSQLIQSP